MVSDIWGSRDLPVLEAVARLEAEGRDRVSAEEIGGQTGFDIRDVFRSVEALVDGGYLEASLIRGDGEILRVVGVRLLPNGRRACGQWPTTDVVDNFLHVLSSRIEEEASPDTRSSLIRLREALLGVGSTAASGLFLAWLKRAAGLP